MARPPTFQQEILVAAIRSQWAFDMVRVQPTLATVLRSGGTGLVVVKPDGAAADSEQVIPFLAGTRWTAGQRIVTVPTQGGAPVAIGVVPTSASQYAVVGTEHIIPGSITADLLASGAISFRSLDVDTQGRISGAQTAAQDAKSLATTAKSRADDAWGKGDNAQTRAGALEGRMTTVEGAASGAQSTANTAIYRLDNLSFTVPNGSITAAKMADNSVTGRTIPEATIKLIHTDFDTIRQPINQIATIAGRVTKLCNKFPGTC